MSRTDSIADAFTIIRNASSARKEETYVSYSNIVFKICGVLKQEGYLENFKEVDLGNLRKIKVYLKYEGKKGVITKIKRVSTPGMRVYVKKKEVPSVLRGYGLAIVSTSSGVFTDREAKEKGLGGELIGMVW